MNVIQLRGVSKRFGDHVVLDHLDLDIPENDIFGIIGVNGSGKTTLLRLLVGFYTPTEGEVYYQGHRLHDVLTQAKREFGFTTQENSFYPQLTVQENIKYFGSLYGLPKAKIQKNMEDLLSLVELRDCKDVLAQHLSGGMQRRLDFACSLIHDPKVLILDEPTEDLDPLLRREIVRLIKRINGLGITIIITSHLLDDVELLCDHVAILHNQSIMKTGTIADLRQLYHFREEVHLELQSQHYDSLVRDLQLKDYLIEDGKMVVYTDDAQGLLHQILQLLDNTQDRLIGLDIKKPSLKEVFGALTSKTWLENSSL